MNSASARASSVLPTPVGPRNRNVPIGRSGSCRPARERRSAVATASTASSWPIDAFVQPVLHVDQLLGLALEQPADGDAGPARDDLGDVVGVDLLLEEHEAGVPSRSSDSLLLVLGELAFELRDLLVEQLRGTLVVGLALRALGLHARLLETLFQVRDLVDRLLLVLPARLHLRRALLQLGELALERLAALGRGLVGLLLQRGQLDLELHHATVDLVDLDRHRVDLDPDPGGRLVDQVDRLVGQEAVGDVARRERRRGDQRAVLDAHSVVLFVAALQPAQDRDRVLDGGLADHHRLEAALERRVLLDVLAVLVERRRADRAQFAAREHRLEQVGRVDCAFGGARADDRVELVEEQDDRALGLGDLFEHRLQAVLELAAVLGAGDQRADVERDHAPVAQRLGHVAGDDPLGEALDDRRLADARLADQHRVVLGAAGEHLDHAADLLVAADHRVELALFGDLGQVAAEALERLVFLLGVRVGDAVGAADLAERLRDLVVVGAVGAQQLAGLARRCRESASSRCSVET